MHRPNHTAAFWHLDTLVTMAQQQGIWFSQDRGKLCIHGPMSALKFDIGLVRVELLAWLQAADRI